MLSKRIFTESQFYKELERMNVGIDLVAWDDGSEGYIYYEEDNSGNHSEAFYKKLSGAMYEYQMAEEFHGEKKED